MKKVLSLIFLFCISAVAQERKADVIFKNGDIYLGATNHGAKVVLEDHAAWLAVADGKVIGYGSNAADIGKSFQGPYTQIIDLHGHFVMPGFNDAHSHLASGGFEKLNVNLVGTKSLEDMQSRIAARVKTAAPGEWILGRGWDHTKWPTVNKTPTRQDLDKVTGDHPAIFGRVDGHIAIANTAALKAAGITRDTQPKQGSAIDKDSNGEPTGILREDPAMSLVYSKIPPKTMEQRRRGMELALKDARENGVTSDEDNSDWEDFLVLEEMQKEGKLTLRVTEWLPLNASVEDLKKMRAHHPADDVWLHTGMLKGYMDGSLGSRTAALLGPYSDDPHNSGLARFTQEDLNQKVKDRAAAGFQIGFHAIGDKGVDMALKAFAQAGNRPELRFRIEHDQIVEPSQIARYKQLGVIASVQPSHLLTDMRWVTDRVGKERASTSYPWKSYLDAGVPIGFGTDYPVESINPFRGIYSAITRKSEDGTQEFYPKEKLTIDQAIAAYTTGSAYAEFDENIKGSLAPGMLADFIVLDRDITKVPPAQILKTKVLRTVVGGKTVYEAPEAATK